jgi:hypothetical protein
MPNNAIQNSSSDPIKKAIIRLGKNQFKKKRIIGPHNFYLKNTVDKINDRNIPIQTEPLCDYLAASVISHCYDGWNFLSRSIESFLNGDISSSIHFAYYSELRAVMSLMASNGIGIFDKRHVYFDSTQTPMMLFGTSAGKRLTTHEVAHQLINAWSQANLHREDVLKLINISNRSLSDWLIASGGTASSQYAQSIVKQWIERWSIDLKLDEDQKLRNETSYRPRFKINKVDIKDSVNNILKIWSVLEPVPSNRFQEIDKYLWRIGIEEAFKLTTGRTIKNKAYISFVDNIFQTLGEPQGQFLYDFLLRRVEKADHFILTEARKDSGNNKINLTNPSAMICRAILLLRISTGFAGSHINAQTQALQFWWEETSLSMGLINSIPSGIKTYDLYSDISDSISNVQINIHGLNTVRDALTLQAEDLNNIKQMQRACFWGLGL